MNYAQIGQKIRLAREEAGLSQEELGNKLGCAGVTISMWEMGKRRVSLEDLHKIARVLGKPLACFFPDGSLSLNVDHQIGALLQRSIGDFLGTRQIPVYRVDPLDDGSPSPRIVLERHMSVAAQAPVDFGLVIPDDRLAAVGIGAGDVAVCRHCDGHPPQEDCIMLQIDGASFYLGFVNGGEEVACPADGSAPGASNEAPRAICGTLVFLMKQAEDILAALKSVQQQKTVEAR